MQQLQCVEASVLLQKQITASIILHTYASPVELSTCTCACHWPALAIGMTFGHLKHSMFIDLSR